MKQFLTAKNVVILQKNNHWEVEYEGPSEAYRLSITMSGLKGDAIPNDILRKMAKAILSGDFLAMPERVNIIR